MRASLRIRLYIGFALALLLVILGGILSYISFAKQRNDAEWVEHTYEAITRAQRINYLVHEMESSGITYRSTRVFSKLGPYFENRERVLPLLNDLKRLVKDNRIQLKKLDTVESDVIGLLNYWENLGRLDSSYVFANLQNVALEERQYLDEVYTGLVNFILAERELLSERNTKSEKGVQAALRIQVINSAFILLLATILMIVCFREFSRRVDTQLELKRKLKEETELREDASEKNWLLRGMSDVNEHLHGDVALPELAGKCLPALLSYLELPAGAVYYYDEEEGVLRLCAGVALTANLKATWARGEGLTGQAALGKQLKILNNVPPGYWKIESASGSIEPGALIFVPLWHDSALIGVLELASFTDVPARVPVLLDAVSTAIATAFNAALARTKVMSLLQTVNRQKEELEAQQHKLQDSNEELTRQSEVLQASEEELRVQEEELRQINEEMNVQNSTLEQARQELAQKAQELEQSSRYKSEFLANMSHELRTPLNSILILARLLEEDKGKNLTDKQKQYAGIIHKSGSDLLQLINDILDLSKIEAGRVEFYIEPVEVKVLVNEEEQLFAVVAEEKNIRFETHIAAEVPAQIRTDKQRLEQVIRNLLSNAFKFTPAGGAVRMDWAVEKDELRITVSDTGPGIPEDKQMLIFDAFRQADGSTSRKFGGTGLGLSISKELVERLGGRIHLESREGQGSRFTIVLPVAPPEAAPESALPPARKQSGGMEDDRGQLEGREKLVLIIEDDPHFAVILRDFAREKGYKTVVAADGNEGLLLARKYHPLAIILDINLPLIDGNSVLKILKSHDELKDILVHVISAGEISLQTRDKIVGFSQKPLQIADLEAVFSGIGKQLKALFKKILVISNSILSENASLPSLSRERRMETTFVKNMEEAAREIGANSYDGIILDVEQDIQQGIHDLARLKKLTKSPVIVYLDHDISEADDLLLTKDAAALVRNSTFSTDRLMEELELFLYKLNDVSNNAPSNLLPAIEEDNLTGKKVLVVDDDMRNVFSLSALFSGYGMEVVTAADGKEGLARLEENPDTCIVLMDIMMPEMDGYEAMRRIRQDDRFSSLPVIAVTAKAMTGDREKCIEAGASDYISKPIDNAKLLSLMRVWLKQQNA